MRVLCPSYRRLPSMTTLSRAGDKYFRSRRNIPQSSLRRDKNCPHTQSLQREVIQFACHGSIWIVSAHLDWRARSVSFRYLLCNSCSWRVKPTKFFPNLSNILNILVDIYCKLPRNLPFCLHRRRNTLTQISFIIISHTISETTKNTTMTS